MGNDQYNLMKDFSPLAEIVSSNCCCQTPLHLANATQLQLVGVGVDFSHGKKEGRKEGRNPPLASSRRIGPTCLNFGDCLVGVRRVYGNCLEGVWRVSGGCLVGVWRVSGGCLVDVRRVS